MMIGIVAMHFAASFVMPMASAMRFRRQQIVQTHNAHYRIEVGQVHHAFGLVGVAVLFILPSLRSLVAHHC
jgi:hypothetical protein